MRFFLGLLLLIPFLPVEARQEVRVRSYVTHSDGDSLTLAHLLPTSVENQDLRALFSSFPLADAPKIGEKRVLTNSLISSLIRRAKAKGSGAVSQYHFRIPSEVVVENPGAILPETEIRRSLVEQWQKQCPDCRFEIQELSLPRLPKSKKVSSWYFIGAPPLPKGSFSIGIRVETKENSKPGHDRFWLNGVAKIQKKVPITTRSLNFGERLLAKDFRMEFRDVTYARDSIPDVSMLAGRKIKMTKASGQIVWQNDLAKEKAVSRGDWIKVKSTEGALEISMMALAENDGFIGDVIRLKGGTSKQRLSGVAVARGQVELK